MAFLSCCNFGFWVRLGGTLVVFYAFNNGNGGIYRIDNVANPTPLPLKVFIAAPSSSNDGLHVN
jgi:hypothetical protein